MINGVSQQPTMQKGMNLHIAGMSALNGIWKKGEISGIIGTRRKWTTKNGQYLWLKQQPQQVYQRPLNPANSSKVITVHDVAMPKNTLMIRGFIGSCRKWTTIANSPCSGVIVYLRYE